MSSLERVIAKNPTSSLFARLADAYLRQGDMNRAIEICRQGLRYRPSYVSGHVVLGKSHFAAGMWEEARRAFNKALHLDPHHTVAIWYLGQIDRTMGWDDLALRNFQKARDLDPLSQSLQRAIEEILTSISSQMGQRLLNEVREEKDLAEEEGDPANRPERPGDGRWETEEVRPQDRPEAETRVSSPSASPADPADPEKGVISRLVEEIETGLAPVAVVRAQHAAPLHPLEEDEDLTRDAQTGTTPGGDESEETALPAAEEPPPTLANRRRRPGPSRGNGAGPGGQSGRTAENGGSIPITTATLAEIYAGQGLIAQAIAIFEKVLEREPDNARAQERLNALKAQRVENTSR
ncbi:tetratricopeptide repeat protein [bacterium]|nr:tetratricopeptide repeat protein [bacterium]